MAKRDPWKPPIAPGLAGRLLDLIPADGSWVLLGYLMTETHSFITDAQCTACYQRHLDWKHANFKADASLDERSHAGRKQLIIDALRYYIDKGTIESDGGIGIKKRYRRQVSPTENVATPGPVTPADAPPLVSAPRLAVPIAEIRVEREAQRQDRLHDLDVLVASIQELGLLHAILVSPGRTLICGYRRLKAYRRLGRESIEVHVPADLDDAVRMMKAERDENRCRRNQSIAEADALQEELLELEKPRAKERQRAGQKKGGKTAGKGRPKAEAQVSPTVGETYPQTDDGEAAAKAAEATDYSAETLRQYRKIKQAAEADPGRFGDLLDKANRTNTVKPAYREMKRRQGQAKAQPEGIAPSPQARAQEKERTPAEWVRHWWGRCSTEEKAQLRAEIAQDKEPACPSPTRVGLLAQGPGCPLPGTSGAGRISTSSGSR